MVINLAKGKGITDDPKKKNEKTAPWKGNIDSSIVPNLNDYCEQKKELRKKSVWTVEPRRHAAKVQSPRQEAKRD